MSSLQHHSCLLADAMGMLISIDFLFTLYSTCVCATAAYTARWPRHIHKLCWTRQCELECTKTCAYKLVQMPASPDARTSARAEPWTHGAIAVICTISLLLVVVLAAV